MPHTPLSLSRRSPHLRVLAWVLAALSLCSNASAQPSPPAPAPAPTAEEVQQLLHGGALDQALQATDRWLAAQPRNPQARFMQGVVLSRQNKRSEAIQAFTTLTQNYPELPEPYNNLAVLHAAEGRLDDARTALEMAIRLHPSYAAAHLNLGDLYLRLAAQAYRTAVQLNADAPGLAERLQQIERLQPAQP